MKKLIIWNIILLLLVLISIEIGSLVEYYNSTKALLALKNSAGLIQNFRYTLAHNFSTSYFSHLFSEHISVHSDKRPVLLIGCSYVQGSGLNENQTLAYKIFQKTNRSVYKRGIPGGGIQLALHQFETGEMKKSVPDAEYIIYVFIGYHIHRLFSYQLDYIETEVNQRYKLENGKLVKIRQPLFPYYYSLFSVKLIQKSIANKLSIKEYENYNLFNAVMSELLNQAKNTYNNSKFVILLYPSADIMNNNDSILPDNEINNLKNMGFFVINAENLTTLPIRKEEYRISDKDHPNEKAWDAIVDNLIKTLNL